MEAYPISILPQPSSASFSGSNDQASTVRTQMDSGRYRQRSRFTATMNTYKVSWEMDDFQWGMFQSWIKYKISRGADFFTIDIPTGGDGLKNITARIVAGTVTQTYKDVLNWTVSASVETEDNLDWSEDDYDTLLTIGDPDLLELAAAELDTLINLTFPANF